MNVNEKEKDVYGRGKQKGYKYADGMMRLYKKQVKYSLEIG